MKYLKGKPAEEAEHFCNRAAELAANSKCSKAQHGAVIVKDSMIIGEGWNTPVPDGRCNPCLRTCIEDNSRVELCNAVYAQHNAIMDALKRGHELKGTRMYHAKLKNGQIVRNDEPHFTPCSRLIQHVGVGDFVLLNEKGYCLYTSDEYNRLSYEFHEKEE
jgi:deoxycytidylate deaminase